MGSDKNQPTKLYKYKFVYQERESYEEIPGVDWYTLTQAEYDTCVVNYINTGTYGFEDGIFGEDCELVSEEFELATEDEMEAYNEGFIEGNMLAKAQGRWENYNGVSYRLDGIDPEVTTTKLFLCGSCARQYEFSQVAKYGEFYMSVVPDIDSEDKEHVLWHVCVNCAND